VPPAEGWEIFLQAVCSPCIHLRPLQDPLWFFPDASPPPNVISSLGQRSDEPFIGQMLGEKPRNQILREFFVFFGVFFFGFLLWFYFFVFGWFFLFFFWCVFLFFLCVLFWRFHCLLVFCLSFFLSFSLFFFLLSGGCNGQVWPLLPALNSPPFQSGCRWGDDVSQ